MNVVVIARFYIWNITLLIEMVLYFSKIFKLIIIVYIKNKRLLSIFLNEIKLIRSLIFYKINMMYLIFDNIDNLITICQFFDEKVY